MLTEKYEEMIKHPQIVKAANVEDAYLTAKLHITP